MTIFHPLVGSNINEEDICLVDSETTHSILKNKKYFSNLKIIEANITTTSGNVNLIESFGKANILFEEQNLLL